jgi:hypothetical protein
VLVSPPPPPPQHHQQPPQHGKMAASQFTPPMSHDDDLLFPAYSTYPPPDEMGMMPPYGASAQPSYARPVVAEPYPDYLSAAAVPVTLPPLSHFSDAIKRDAGFGAADDGSLNDYMSYGFLGGIDMHAANAYDHSNPHVSSLRQHHGREQQQHQRSPYAAPPAAPPAPSPYHHRQRESQG